jgi:hypothetical protein
MGNGIGAAAKTQAEDIALGHAHAERIRNCRDETRLRPSLVFASQPQGARRGIDGVYGDHGNALGKAL